jgi:hypothetical protein
MTDTAPSLAPAAPLGWVGFLTGAVARVLTIVTFWAGPLAPQQTPGVTLGELAADIAASAARSVAGQPQPAAVMPARDVGDWIAVGVGALAGLAMVLGLAAVLRRERTRVAVSGVVLGGLAVGFQLFNWAVMMAAGALVVAALVYALRDSLGDTLGG